MENVGVLKSVSLAIALAYVDVEVDGGIAELNAGNGGVGRGDGVTISAGHVEDGVAEVNVYGLLSLVAGKGSFADGRGSAGDVVGSVRSLRLGDADGVRDGVLKSYGGLLIAGNGKVNGEARFLGIGIGIGIGVCSSGHCHKGKC